MPIYPKTGHRSYGHFVSRRHCYMQGATQQPVKRARGDGPERENPITFGMLRQEDPVVIRVLAEAKPPTFAHVLRLPDHARPAP